mgnify:FL=1
MPPIEQNIIIPAIFRDSFASTKEFQIWYGGRGAGKSWTKAIQLLLKLMSPGYARVIFARDTQKNARLSQFQLIKDILVRFNWASLFHINDALMKITYLPNGNFMMGGSFEQPDNLRSAAEPTDFWAEEPLNRRSEIDRGSFLDIRGSLRNSFGKPTVFHFTFNPITKSSWIYKDFFIDKLYDAELLFTTYKDNQFCPPDLANFLESLKTIDERRYKVDCLGEWGVSFAGLIYPHWELTEELFQPIAYGVDFGYVDPTVIVAIGVKDIEGSYKKTLIVRELLYKTNLTSQDIVDRIKQLNLLRNVPMYCDSARPEIIEQIRQAGYQARPVPKGIGSIKAGIDAVLKYNLRIHRQSPNLLREIESYAWDSYKDGELLEQPVQGLDHAMDAMRYAVMGIQKKVITVGI